MTRIVVFTDVHFDDGLRHNGIDPVERLETGLAHAAKHVRDIDYIVITGDLAHRGEIPSYAKLKHSLQSVTHPLVLMIGNHDNRENFLEIFTHTATDENGHIQQTIDTDDHRLIFLDTLDGPPYDYPLSHRGMLCEKRLNWLRTQLGSAGERECIIFMHHHPHPVGFKAMDMIRLVNGEEFYSVLEEFNNVSHISCGHVHRTISGSHRGIPFSVFKSTVGQMPMKFDLLDFHMETTTEPAAYGILDIYKGGVTVHTEDFGLSDLDTYS
ncbi:MAG: phosphodiesterase [Pseudomonadota bacterium]